jgi:protein tyrosine phosphatase (PTP) superfamily phosphohydrolase (DUF442 family)
MKIIDLLLEYDINKIKQLDSALASRKRDNSAPQATNATQLADYLDRQLGIKSGELIFWIIHRYLTKTFNNQYGISRWEDIGSRLIPALDKFTKLKNKKKIPGSQRDINRFKSLSQLEDLLDTFPEEETASQKEQYAAQEKQFYDSGQARLIHNDSQIKVVVPLTQEASCYFGKNTRWCTAAKNDNMFDRYNRRGPLYIVLFKKENARYQFHFQSHQFMNEKDQKINPNELANKYPILWTIFQPIAEENKSLILNQNPSLEVQLAAVKKDGRSIRYIDNPSEKVQLAAINQFRLAIEYIKDPCLAAQLAVVQEYGRIIQYINDPSELVQLAAVQQNGLAIEYTNDPSLEVQLAAVQQNGLAIQYIENPSLEVQLAAVQENGHAIRYINSPSLEVQLAAVQEDGYAIQYIEHPSLEVQLAAVQQNGEAIYYINDPSLEIQLEAVQQHSNAIEFIKNPSLKVQLAAKKAKRNENS